MNQVKQTIVKQLSQTLLECNNSDQKVLGGSGYINDLHPRCSNQESAYGHISNALRDIAGDEFIDWFIETGEFDFKLVKKTKF